jgi:hypothetical protein
MLGLLTNLNRTVGIPTEISTLELPTKRQDVSHSSVMNLFTYGELGKLGDEIVTDF